MIQAIAIEREFGCGGSEIAGLLAQRLGWKLWDHELTQEIARLTNSSPQAVEKREWKDDPRGLSRVQVVSSRSVRGSLAANRSPGIA